MASETGRTRISSGSPWEPIVGYSRAVRVGNHVYVAGTTATDETGQVVHAADARAQTRLILQKIDRALTRIEEGTFGICERCEEEISPKRLEARPVTTLCIRCKEEQEKKEKSYG